MVGRTPFTDGRRCSTNHRAAFPVSRMLSPVGGASSSIGRTFPPNGTESSPFSRTPGSIGRMLSTVGRPLSPFGGTLGSIGRTLSPIDKASSTVDEVVAIVGRTSLNVSIIAILVVRALLLLTEKPLTSVESRPPLIAAGVMTLSIGSTDQSA